jgi:DeoR/GlpR family transcriptional regulator of sugar metabolism
VTRPRRERSTSQRTLIIVEIGAVLRRGRLRRTTDRPLASHILCEDAARRSIPLLDHTKTPRTGPHLVAEIGGFDAVVIDDAADPAEVAAMRATGARVVLVPAG